MRKEKGEKGDKLQEWVSLGEGKREGDEDV